MNGWGFKVSDELAGHVILLGRANLILLYIILSQRLLNPGPVSVARRFAFLSYLHQSFSQLIVILLTKGLQIILSRMFSEGAP